MKTYKKILFLLPVIFLLGFATLRFCTTTIVEETIQIGITTGLIETVALNDEESISCELRFVEVMVECDKEGTINIFEPGTYSVTYTAVYSDRIEVVSTTILVLSEYYSSVVGLSGNSLLLGLRNLMQSTVSTLPYGEARYILQESNVDPQNPNNVRLAYNHESVPKEWDGGVTWEREHVFPVSRLGVNRPGNSNNNLSTDLHNLMPIQRGENVRKSNKGLDLVTSEEYYYIENDKGLTARILFYMVLTYPQLSLGEEVGELQMGRLSVLDYWNLKYEPDDFEINRNNVIESYQGNRNPFIDYPLFWELIKK